MKIVILAGGLGTRISELTKTIPKPMVKINKIPIIERIMNHYSKFGYSEFLLALGYKKNIIKDHFNKSKYKKWKIILVDTGRLTMTGGRIKRLKKYFSENENFMVTYGDGLSNVNIKKLVKFHIMHKKMVTLTAVRPPARFGALKIKGNKIIYFKEKSSLDEGWINGGFFVMNKKFLKFIKDDRTYLERKPLEIAAKLNQLKAFKHYGFWQCMDTKRDKERLEQIIKKKKN